MFKEYFKFYKQISSVDQINDIIDFSNEVDTELIVSC